MLDCRRNKSMGFGCSQMFLIRTHFDRASECGIPLICCAKNGENRGEFGEEAHKIIEETV